MKMESIFDADEQTAQDYTIGGPFLDFFWLVLSFSNKRCVF